MKKYLFILMAAGCLAVACEKKGEVLSPDEQKATIEATAVAAVEAVDLDNWKGTADIIVASSMVLNDSEADADLKKWAEGVEKSWEVTNSGKSYPVTMVDLTKIKGEFTIKDKVLSRKDASSLSLSFNLDDEANTACKATATVKNSSTKLMMDQDVDREYDGSGNITKETITSEEWIIVPSLVDVKLTAAGKTQVRAKFTTDLDIAGAEPRPTDKRAATAELTFGEYKLNVTRAKYSDTNVQLKTEFKKGSTSILAASFTAKGKLAFQEDDDIDVMKSDGKVNVDATLMGSVELKGSLDWTAYKNVEEVSKDAKTAEEAIKAVAAALEKAVNVTVYVDGTAQAKLGFEPVGEGENWNMYTVIRFTDGSAYELADEFFSPNNYGRVIEAVNNLLAKIENYFNPGKNDLQ